MQKCVLFSLLLVLLFLGCSETEEFSSASLEYNYFSLEDSLKALGVKNAVKKAAQMKNVKWKTTAKGMPFNNGFFECNTEYSGIPYSNVLAYNQHVFLDVSIETFVTAVHNPRSVLYTENVSGTNSKSSLGRKYNGVGSACYYGSTCSYLVVYALGLPHGILAAEFPYWDEMEVVEDQSSSGVQLADVLSSIYHVVLVTDIKRYKDGTISTITITENASKTTSSRVFAPSQFDKYLSTGYTILRYKNIDKNIEYTPYTEFVAVDGETPSSYSFNEDLCPNYGNKSNYVEGDMVVINIAENYKKKGYTHMMVYKDDQLLYSLSISDIDMVLKGLSYGDYKVCLSNGFDVVSQYAYFKVVNMSVSLDNSSGQDVVYFASENAKPLYYDFCAENGQKGPSGVKGILSHVLTPSEISEGKATLSPPLITTKDTPYIKVHFETEYGRTTKMARKDFFD